MQASWLWGFDQFINNITTPGGESMNQKLIDRAIEQIKKDVESGDLTAIDELLKYVPAKNLEAFLSEDL
jgi:preprotein translocase subunit SecA